MSCQYFFHFFTVYPLLLPLKNVHHPAVYILLTAWYYNFLKHKRVCDIFSDLSVIVQTQLKCSYQLFHGPLSITGWVKWIYIFEVTWPILVKATKKQGLAQLPHKLKSLRSPLFPIHCYGMSIIAILKMNQAFIWEMRDLYVTPETLLHLVYVRWSS